MLNNWGKQFQYLEDLQNLKFSEIIIKSELSALLIKNNYLQSKLDWYLFAVHPGRIQI